MCQKNPPPSKKKACYTCCAACRSYEALPSISNWLPDLQSFPVSLTPTLILTPTYLTLTPLTTSGDPLVKAINDGRYQATNRPPRPRWLTRGQVQLVPTKPEDTLDYRKPFLVFLASWYCANLNPPVEDGLNAQIAVLGYLREKKTFKHLIKIVRSCFCTLSQQSNSQPSNLTRSTQACTRRFPTNCWCRRPAEQ